MSLQRMAAVPDEAGGLEWHVVMRGGVLACTSRPASHVRVSVYEARVTCPGCRAALGDARPATRNTMMSKTESVTHGMVPAINVTTGDARRARGARVIEGYVRACDLRGVLEDAQKMDSSGTRDVDCLACLVASEAP